MSILTVDDDPDMRLLCRVNLEAAGYCVREAPNGAEALEVLTNGQPVDLVLLDVMMPIMGGWDLLECMSQDARLSQIPVVMFSAATQVDHECTRNHVPFVEKPFSPGELLETIRAVLAA